MKKETTAKINAATNALIEEIKNITGITKERLVNDLLIRAGKKMLEEHKNEKNKSNQAG